MFSSDLADDRVATVADASADGDWLVTVAVPPGHAVGELLEAVEEDLVAADQLDAELAAPRRRALERVRRELADQAATPENGLVVYAGVLDGEVRSVVFDDLPAPVTDRVYTHDNEFDLAPLSGAHESTTAGLLVVERGGAALGTYDGRSVAVHETVDSDVPGKTRAGGQSAARFERRRETRKREFFETVGDAAARHFLDDGEPVVDALCLGGTAVTVEAFRDADVLDHRLAGRLVDTYHVEHAGEQGLRELAEKADGDEFGHNAAARDALDDFFAALGADTDDGDPVAFGADEVDRALTYDAVDTLLVSEELPVDERENLRERVEAEGGDCVVIPTAVDRGERFAEAFDGRGAVLRFPID